MWPHAICLTPVRFTAGTEMKMAFLRRDNTKIALREASETRVAIPLVKTFPGQAAAVDTFNLLQVFNFYPFAEPVVQRYLLTTKFQPITDRAGQLGIHLVQITLDFHRSPVQAKY